MKTGSIDVDNGEAKVVGAKREGGSDREIINGMVKQPKKPVIPSGENPPGRTRGRLIDERVKGLR
jgi:hypothetical protein